MSQSSTNKGNQRWWEDRHLTDPDKLKTLQMTATDATGTAPVLQDAYKKHATELANIEDRQHKLNLLVLGIFSAGATLIASGHVVMSYPLKFALGFLAIAIVLPGIHYNNELHSLRGFTRELLVRCEIALGFHEQNRFLKGETLYAGADIAYSQKGQWLRNSYYWIVIPVCAAFICVVIFAKTTSPAQPPAVQCNCGTGVRS